MAGLLDNKVVIVAGLGGIGNGLAMRYTDEGARSEEHTSELQSLV